MSDDAFYAPNRLPPPARKPRPWELLWSIRRDGRQFDCELRYHGEYGVEMQLLRDREWFYGRIWPLHKLALEEAADVEDRYVREGGVLIG